ncbi:DUF7257 domain-containing protein [Mycolicibacterium brisbanense]
MTVPNGPAGINAAGWPAIISAAGHSATSAADLKGLDQDTVVELFKEKFVGTKGSGVSVFTSDTGPLAEVFKGLPNIPGGSLPLRILAGIAGRLLGVDPLTLVSGTTNEEQITSVILALEKVPFLGEIIELLTGIEDGDPNDLATWARGLLNELSPINLANAFGRLSLPQIGGVSIMDLVTEVPNMLDPFSASNVPTKNGWSFDATADAAKVICDGTYKTLYLYGAPIKVDSGQALNATVPVTYSGITSGAGQTIRYVLDTYQVSDPIDSDVATTVTLGAITNPSGTITAPAVLGNANWPIPAGVKSLRPVLIVDMAVTAGTVYWKNRPVLQKILDSSLAGGLPAALNSLGNYITTWVHSALTSLGMTPSGVLLDDIFDLSDELELIQSNAQQGVTDAANALANFTTFLSSSWQALLDGVKGASGGGIADIINRLAHITSGGLFDAAKISNVTGTASQSTVDGLVDLNSLTSQIRDILAGVPTVPTLPIIQTIKDWFTANQAKTQALNTSGQLNGANVVGTIANSVVPGIGQIIDAGVQGAGNIIGSGFGIPDFLASLSDLQSQLASANQQLAQLMSTTTGGNNSGKSYFINIGDYADSATPPSVFTKILDTGAGSVATSGGVLSWQDSGSSAAAKYYVHNAGDLITDYFEVHGIMPRRSETEFPDASYDVLWARGNTAGDTRCFLRFGYQRARMGCVVTGTTTLFGSSDISVSAPAGSRITYRGGTVGGLRVFQMLVNGDVIETVTDTGNVSQAGANYRKWGWGMEAAARFGGQATPGTLSALAANDNVPAPVVGSGFRISGTSSLNNVEAITPDMSWASGILTVNTEGWFLATLDVVAADSVSTDWTVQIKQNGTVKSQADYKALDDGNNRTGHRNAQTTTGLYLKAGHTVQPVIAVTTSSTLVHFECILLNKSTL